jgi:hypothetical protein
MEDNDVYDELKDYDNDHKNKYEEHWGTLLNFLDESKLDEATISRLNNNDNDDNINYLQNHDLGNEVRSDHKPKNMADVYRQKSSILKANEVGKDPDDSYVYQSKKKAVVMIRKKVGTQLSKENMDSSFYSQKEGRTKASASLVSRTDEIGTGYNSMSGTPAPYRTNKVDGSFFPK